MQSKNCKRCNTVKSLEEFSSNKSTYDGKQTYCKECVREYSRAYFKEKRYKYQKKYHKNNPEKVKIWGNESSKRYQQKKQSDPVYRKVKNLRRYCWLAVKDMLHDCLYVTKFGCSRAEFRSRIESMFKDGMSWDNHGEWHIDHIKPFDTAESVKDVVKLNHINNIQPLWAKENLIKSNKWQVS